MALPLPSPENRLGDIGAAIGQYARGRGYGMLADHSGHGIGREMHEGPDVPNEGRAGKGFRLRPGLVIAIEPMLIADGTDDYRHDADGWDPSHRFRAPGLRTVNTLSRSPKTVR